MATVSDSHFDGPRCEVGAFAIRNDGAIKVLRSTISNSDGVGAAGFYNGGLAILEGTTIRDTDCGTADAGSWAGVGNGGTLLLLNSTISRNHCDDTSALRAYSSSKTLIYNSTVKGEDPFGDSSDTLLLEGEVWIRNSVLARPAVGVVCRGTGILRSLTGNIASDSSCDAIATEGSFLVQDPGLGLLQDNGGTTLTHALLTGSPAIDYATDCTYDHDLDDITPEIPLESDQRRWFRPAEVACDSGAFEADSAPLPIVTGHRVLDCTAQQEIATLIEGETFSVDLSDLALPACLGIGVLMEANASSGDGSVGHDYIPAAGETVSVPYEGEINEPFAYQGDLGWVIPGEIAACVCPAERGDLTHAGTHTLTSTPCSADTVSWVAGDKTAQCETAGGLAGPSFTTSLVVVPEPGLAISLLFGTAVVAGLGRLRRH